MRATQRSEAGLVTLEMALVLPLLLLVLFGILELGLAFARLQVVQNAAREAARTAVLFRTTCSPAAVDAEVRAVIAQFSDTLGINAIQYDGMSFPDSASFPKPATVNACTAPLITVKVSYKHAIPLTGAFSKFFGGSGASTVLTLPGSSTAANQPNRVAGS